MLCLVIFVTNFFVISTFHFAHKNEVCFQLLPRARKEKMLLCLLGLSLILITQAFVILPDNCYLL